MAASLQLIQAELRDLAVQIARLAAHADPAASTDDLILGIRQELRRLDRRLERWEYDPASTSAPSTATASSSGNAEADHGETDDTQLAEDRARRTHARLVDEFAGLRRSYRRALGTSRVNAAAAAAASAAIKVKGVRAPAARDEAATAVSTQTVTAPSAANMTTAAAEHKQRADKTRRLDWATQRELLLSHTSKPAHDGAIKPAASADGASKHGPSSTLLQKSATVTAALQQTHSLLSSELSKSLLSADLLQQSSADVASLDAAYTAVGLLLAGSRALVRELERANSRDRLYIYISLGIFLAVVAWILYRRVISRGIRPIVWITSLALRGVGKGVAVARNRHAGQVVQDAIGDGGGVVSSSAAEGVVQQVSRQAGNGQAFKDIVQSITTAVVAAGAGAAVSSGVASPGKGDQHGVIEDLSFSDDESVLDEDLNDEYDGAVMGSLADGVAQRLQRAVVYDINGRQAAHDEL